MTYSTLSSGNKTIVQFHEDLPDFAFDFNNILLYALSDSLTSLSKTREKFWKNFAVRSYYIPNPMKFDDDENFQWYNSKKFSNTILWIGRVAYNKNTIATLPIIHEVKKLIPNVKLKIVGDFEVPEVYEQMKKLIIENHLENNVEFCGYHKDVAPFYESADVMLSTSKAEGWGLSITESKFYELPDSELLRGGKGCEIVKQDDYKAAARAVVKILTDTEYRCTLSAEARESLQPFIDYDIVGAWKRIFDDLDNDSPVPPYDIENEKIQTFILNELLDQKLQVRKLSAQLKNVHLGIT